MASSRLISISIIVVLLVLAFMAMRNRPRERQFKTTEELIQFLSEEAVKDAHENSRVELDYSPISIKQIEQILGQLHDQYVKNPSSVSERGLGSAYGAYVGECIRKSEAGVSWGRDHPVGGEKSYPLQWHAGESFPMAWCRRRIIAGEEENVWIKYKVLKERSLVKKDPPVGH
jgi:hypothetical protein